MMRFWTNFAKNGEPGKSSNSIYWNSMVKNNEFGSDYLVIDSKKNLKLKMIYKLLNHYQKSYLKIQG